MVRDQFLVVRMSESERERLKRLASLLDQSPSVIVRDLIVVAARSRGLAPASIDASDASKEKNPR